MSAVDRSRQLQYLLMGSIESPTVLADEIDIESLTKTEASQHMKGSQSYYCEMSARYLRSISPHTIAQ